LRRRWEAANVEEESPLDLLVDQIREAEAQRQTVEEELNRTPGWRFRQRARLQRRFERRLAKEREVMAFAEMISEKSDPPRPRKHAG
jgi:hypothetical protein